MRIRTIKPEFFIHERLAELEPLYRIAFIGLWCVADRSGRFKWRPKRLKAQILPYDEIDFSRVLDALVTGGHLVKYECDGEEYGSIPSFESHQHINNRELLSELPPPPEVTEGKQDMTRGSRVKDASGTRHDLDQGEGKGREEERKGKEGNIYYESGDSRSGEKPPPKDDFYLTSKGDKLTGQKMHRFEEFWKCWIKGWKVGRDSGKRAAADSWHRIHGYCDELAEQIIRGAKAEAAARQVLIQQGKKPKWAQGWIKERRWEAYQDSADDTPYNDIVDAFNDIVATGRIAPIQTPTGERLRKIAVLYSGMDDMDGVRGYFKRISQSSRLMGLYGSTPAKADWLLEWDTAAKVMDGQFDNQR